MADGVEGSPLLEPSAGVLVGVLGLLGNGMSDGVDSPVGDAAGELGQDVGDDVVGPVGEASGE